MDLDQMLSARPAAVRRVTATEHGLATLADLELHLRHVEEHVLGGLREDDRETMRALLQRLAAHINEADPAADACEIVHEIGLTAARHVR